MNRELKGRHRLDMVPGDKKTMMPDDRPTFYWKCLGETEIPFMIHGNLVQPRWYILKGKCPMCGYYVILVYLGTLGGLDWYRCRSCGTEVGEVSKK
jgi:hypothetical protein